jgi:hypothetical protein
MLALEEQQRVWNLLLVAQFDEALLQGERGGVVDAAEIDE